METHPIINIQSKFINGKPCNVSDGCTRQIECLEKTDMNKDNYYCSENQTQSKNKYSGESSSTKFEDDQDEHINKKCKKCKEELLKNPSVLCTLFNYHEHDKAAHNKVVQDLQISITLCLSFVTYTAGIASVLMLSRIFSS